MKFLVGRKKEMTQKFRQDGRVFPVTKIEIFPCVVTQVKVFKKDGYTALQIGCGETKKISKPLKGHLKDLPQLRFLQEVRMDKVEKIEEQFQRGQQLAFGEWQVGERVQVRGFSKGKGFQGVVKRHHFSGSPATHGHKDQLRMPGSIGAGGVQNVKKGKHMGGRMGYTNVTVKNLKIVEVDALNWALYVGGAVPGGRNTLLMIKTRS